MKLISSIATIADKTKKDNVNAFAAESALFIIMSFVPFLVLLMTLIKYTPLTQETLLSFINNFAPQPFRESMTSIINQVYQSVSPTALLVIILSVLWTAGKGFNSILDGLNSVFDINDKRNAFVQRLYSILYTIIFVVILVICLVLIVLGNQLLGFFNRHVPFIANIIELVLDFRVLITIVLFTLFFTFLYVAIPRKRTKIRTQIPGALFSAIGWTGFSFFFSLYVNYSKNLSLLYGSLATIVCAMLWLYVCMFIFLLGAEVNLFVEKTRTEKSLQNATDITHHHTHS